MTDILDTTDYRNIPATLRLLADMIEADAYGHATHAALVVSDGDSARVFGMGVDSDNPNGTAGLLALAVSYLLGVVDVSVDEDTYNG